MCFFLESTSRLTASSGLLTGDLLCIGFLQVLKGLRLFQSLTICVFNRLSMLGSPRRLWTERRMVLMSYRANHRSLGTSRQMLPWVSASAW